MIRKLLKTAAIVVIALAPVVAAGTAEAHRDCFRGWRLSRRGFHGDRFRFGGILRFYPGYYGSYYPG